MWRGVQPRPPDNRADRRRTRASRWAVLYGAVQVQGVLGRLRGPRWEKGRGLQAGGQQEETGTQWRVSAQRAGSGSLPSRGAEGVPRPGL